MKKLTVNIGLNNNNYNGENIEKYFNQLYEWQKGYKLIGHKFVEGYWEGEKETTFVGLFDYKYARPSKVLFDFENIAADMDQECIAISCKGLQALAYSVKVKDKKYTFDNQYFYNF